ncbi:protein S100-A1-like [Rhinoraja longicauda]
MACDPTQVQQALSSLLSVFKAAAVLTEGDKSTLDRTELRILIQNQLPFLSEKQDFEQQFEKFFKCMEDKKGSNVDFKEFMCLLATLVMCSECRP